MCCRFSTSFSSSNQKDGVGKIFNPFYKVFHPGDLSGGGIDKVRVTDLNTVYVKNVVGECLKIIEVKSLYL